MNPHDTPPLAAAGTARGAPRWLTGAALGAGTSGVAALLMSRDGLWGIARGDDWVYLRALHQLVQQGHFVTDPLTVTMLIGQLVAFLPLAVLTHESVQALQLAMLVVAAVAVSLTYVWSRLLLPARLAWVPPVVLGLGPLWGGLAGSFMTDVPAYTLGVLALLLGARGLGAPRLRPGWFAAALAVSLVGFSVREFAVAAPLAMGVVLLARWVRERRSADLAGLAGVAVTLTAAALALWWRRSLPGATEAGAFALAHSTSALVGSTVLTLAMMALPGFAAAMRPATLRRLRPGRSSVTVAAAVAATTVLLARPANYVLGLGFDRTVVLEPLRLLRLPESLGRPAWLALVLASALLVGLATLLCLRLVRTALARPGPARRRTGDPRDETALLTAAFVVVVVVLSIGIGVVNGLAFDRYVLPAVPGLTILGLVWADRLPARPTAAVTTAATVAWALLGLGQLGLNGTVAGLRWELSTEAVASGLPASTVIGGYDWFGHHQTQPITVGPPRAGLPDFARFFPDPVACAEVVDAPAPGDEVLARGERRTPFGTRVELVVVARDVGCPARAGSGGPQG